MFGKYFFQKVKKENHPKGNNKTLRFESLEDKCMLTALSGEEMAANLPDVDFAEFYSQQQNFQPSISYSSEFADEGKSYWVLEDQISVHRITNEIAVKLNPEVDSESFMNSLTGEDGPLSTYRVKPFIGYLLFMKNNGAAMDSISMQADANFLRNQKIKGDILLYWVYLFAYIESIGKK